MFNSQRSPRKKRGLVLTLIIAYVSIFLIVSLCFYEAVEQNRLVSSASDGIFQVDSVNSLVRRKFLEPSNAHTFLHPQKEEDEEFTSACLCVSDDNHYLIEWIAYHYFVAGLRRLIIAPDVFSKQSVQHIVDRWKDRMHITVWSNVSQYEFKGPVIHSEQMFYRRQEQFNWFCLRTLKEEGSTWSFVVDVDEYILVNPKVNDKSTYLYREDFIYHEISEPSSVLKTVKQLMLPDETYSFFQPCLIIHRKQFSPLLPSNQTFANMPSSLQSLRLQTMMWNREGEKGWPTKRCKSSMWRPLPGKSIVDMKRLRLQDLDHDDILGGPHNPINTVCPDIFQPDHQSLLVAHHYVGTADQWEARADARGVGARRVKYQYFKTFWGGKENNDAHGWLEGFVNMVGEDEAFRLLKDVGIVEPRERDTKSVATNDHAANEAFAAGDLVQVNYALPGEDDQWCEAEIIDAFPEYEAYNVLFSFDCHAGPVIPASRIRRNGTDNLGCTDD